MTQQSLSSRLFRVAVVGAGLVLAAAAGANAIHNAPVSQVPGIAAALKSDTELRLLALDQEYLTERRYSDPARARETAHQILRGEPLHARAVRVLAYAQEGGYGSAEGQELAQLAHKLTRREDLAEMALMEAAVRRNDAPTALSHFDIFMRANPQGQAAVFPLLSRGLTAPEIRQEISEHLVARSPWVRDFVGYASTEGGNAGATADMVLAAGRRAHPADLEVFGPGLITRLIEAREFGKAIGMLQLLGGERSIVTSGALTAQSTTPRFGGLSWQLASEGNRSANLTATDERGRRGLAVYAAPGAIGTVATKILALPPGRRVMAQSASVRAGSEEGFARWVLRCAGTADSAPFWTGRDLVSGSGGPTRETVNVPAACGYQELSLLVNARTNGSGIDLTVEEFTID